MRRLGGLIALILIAATPAPDAPSETERLSAQQIAAEFMRSQAPVEIDDERPKSARTAPIPVKKAKIPPVSAGNKTPDDGTTPAKPPASAKPDKKSTAAGCPDDAMPQAKRGAKSGSRPSKTCAGQAADLSQKTSPPAAIDKAADRPKDGSDTGVKAPGGQKPVWEVATVAPEAADVAKTTYVVQPGDTLSAVVRKTHAGADVIAHANDLKPPFTLRPGQKLKIPGGRYHIVKKGQSGIAIARAYGVEWTKIIELNHLQEPFTLREGQRLILPPAKDVAKMTLEQRAAAFQIDLTDLATGSEPALAPAGKPAPPNPSPKRQLAPTTPVAEPETTFAGRFDWPVDGRVIRAFGPMDNGGRNDGITIAAPKGTAIAAAADGVVMWVGEHPAFGNVVLVRHGSGWITIYGNADKLLVRRGQSVRIGQTIALVGTSGATADQPQTFFEVLQGKKPVNPMGLLPKRERNDRDAATDDSARNHGEPQNSD